jgi:hypothetical protein
VGNERRNEGDDCGVMCHWPSTVLGDIFRLRGRGMPEPFRPAKITEDN